MQGAPVAAVAVSWMVFSVTILAFPAAPGPDAQGMNYMIVVWGGWLALCLAYYALPRYGGACWFNGPQVTIEEANRKGLPDVEDKPPTLDGSHEDEKLGGSKD